MAVDARNGDEQPLAPRVSPPTSPVLADECLEFRRVDRGFVELAFGVDWNAGSTGTAFNVYLHAAVVCGGDLVNGEAEVAKHLRHQSLEQLAARLRLSGCIS